jgi:hypothetical protein
MPVEVLVEHTVDDGGAYDDGAMGWSGGRFDAATGVLTLEFTPDDSPDLDEEFRSGYAHTVVRFRLIEDREGAR